MKYQTYARRPMSQTTLTQIAKLCVAEFGVKWERVIADERGHAGIAWARQVAQFILRETTGATLQQIGDVFNRDHSGVMYNHRTVQDFMETYPETRAEVEALQAKVLNLMGAVSLVEKAA